MQYCKVMNCIKTRLVAPSMWLLSLINVNFLDDYSTGSPYTLYNSTVGTVGIIKVKTSQKILLACAWIYFWYLWLRSLLLVQSKANWDILKASYPIGSQQEIQAIHSSRYNGFDLFYNQYTLYMITVSELRYCWKVFILPPWY